MKYLFFAPGIFFLFLSVKAQEQEKVGKFESSLPEYHCKHILRNIKLTGRLDDSLWDEAAEVSLNDAITGQPGRYRTEVKALYSANYLYIGFRCEDEFCWGTVTEHDGPIWSEECVEVFLNPADAPHQYYELNLSPLNVIYDACVLTNRTAQHPDGKIIPLPSFDLERLKTATWIDGEANRPGGAKAWCAEYAIPLADIWGSRNVPPQTGDFWRVNFYRIDSPVTGAPAESYAWSPVSGIRFHLPWRFGYLIFE